MKTKNEYKICGDYSIIYVDKKGERLEVLVDTDDLDRVLNVGRWHALKDPRWKNSGTYFCNRPSKQSCIKLHRFIMDCPRDKVVDHINHNTFDNRKSNLRVCTQFENSQNQRTNKSGIVGVHKRVRQGRVTWVGKISKDNIRYSKEVKTKEQAIEFRNKMYEILYGGDE